MNKLRQKKEKIIKDLKKQSDLSKNIVFLNFHGASVNKTSELRKELRNKNVFYKVAKKTLIEKSLLDKEYEGDFPDFKGEMAAMYLYEENISYVLKFINGMMKEGKFKVVGGVYDKEYKDDKFLAALSKIPPKEVLYFSLVNTINAPLKQTVDALQGGITNFIRVLDQISKK